jgi:hypothetical protein
MEEDKREARLIRLPENIWAALDLDAARCRRSSTRQLEAVLAAYYELEDVNLRDLAGVPGFAQQLAARRGGATTARPVQMLSPEPLSVPVLGSPGPQKSKSRSPKSSGRAKSKAGKRG